MKNMIKVVTATFAAFLFLGASLTTAMGQSDFVDTKLSSLQTTLDNINPIPFVPFGLTMDDIMNDHEQRVLFIEGMMVPFKEQVGYLTDYLIDSIEDLTLLSGRELIAPMQFNHNVFENINVVIHFDGELIFTNVSYTVHDDNLAKFLYESFGTEIVAFNSPYNQTALGSSGIRDPWGTTTANLGNLNTSVRFFRRADNAIFVQEGSHFPRSTILDHRFISSISHMFNTVNFNGAAHAQAGSAFQITFFMPSGGTGGAIGSAMVTLR